ncbi:MAG: sugar ABC transporter substrate-binding protein [Candidatus Caldatribacteriaceae bacterium]
MRRLLLFAIMGVLLVSFVVGGQVLAAGKYRFVFVSHAGEENPFWAAVYKGAQDAASLLGADFQFVRPKEEGDLAAQLANFKTALAQKPDGIITTIPHPDMFDEVIQEAISAGIPVICSNTDDPEGAKGNARLSYVGQDLEHAGYFLTSKLTEGLPQGEKYHFLISVGGPGLVWAEQRAKGIVRRLEELGYTYERLDTTMKMDVAQSRIQAYLQANPQTKGVIAVEYNHASAAKAAKNLGRKPGELLIGGFDLVPEVLAEIKSGYIKLTLDQQPYLQGYLPIVQLFLMKEYGLSAWDVNTGNAVVDASNVDLVLELSQKRVR